MPARALRAGLVATCAVGSTLWAGAAPVRPSVQFRAGVNLVHVPVVVTDRGGRVVGALTKDDFEILEDGRPQAVAYFAEGAGPAVSTHLGLLLDASESMAQDLRAATNAAVKFVTQMEELADVTFVDFDSGIRLSRFVPASYPMLFERIRDRRAGGGTALYDALFRYVDSTFERPGQHVVLLHTDGGDSTSARTFGDLQRVLRMANVVVYVVGYLSNQSSSVKMTQQMRVTQIARETGGEAYFPSAPNEIDAIYEKIRAEVAGRYSLGYLAGPSAQDGRFHRLEIKMKAPSHRSLKVRARSGFLGTATASR